MTQLSTKGHTDCSRLLEWVLVGGGWNYFGRL